MDSLVQPGYFGTTADNIVVIKNFVDADDLLAVRTFLSTIDEWVDPGENKYADDGTCLYDAEYWRNRQCSGDIIHRINPHIFSIIEYYIHKMKTLLELRFNVLLSPRPPVLVKWITGTEQQPHADKQLNDGSPNPFPDYDLNSLIYYNDEFDGGELYYPQHDIEIKPEPGLAVAHPGDIHFLHGVRTITSGERWTTPSFYTVTEVL